MTPSYSLTQAEHLVPRFCAVDQPGQGRRDGGWGELLARHCPCAASLQMSSSAPWPGPRHPASPSPRVLQSGGCRENLKHGFLRNSPGKNTGVGSHSLLQGIFPTHGLNPGLLHCRPILYCQSHQGSYV